MVKTVELKPPQDIVDAIRSSEDGSTAPPDAAAAQGAAATRVIANKLVHEEPQKPSDLPEELRHGNDHGAHGPGPMDPEDKHLKYLELQAQQKAEQYDRNHPGAGKAGRGDQAVDSAAAISRLARNQQGSHDNTFPGHTKHRN